MEPQYLRITNWERFQHYKDRRPPWIKFYVELLDDYELVHMDVSTRLLFDCLLLLSARTDNNIPNDPSYIARQVSMPPRQVAAGLEKLLISGFVCVADRKQAASELIAARKQNAKPEKRQRREEKETETERARELKIVEEPTPELKAQNFVADKTKNRWLCTHGAMFASSERDFRTELHTAWGVKDDAMIELLRQHALKGAA